MKAEARFRNQSLEFWSYVKIISQQAGYTERNQDRIKVPSPAEMHSTLSALSLSLEKIWANGKLTPLGLELHAYFEYRARVLNDDVEPRLMKLQKAASVFKRLKRANDPRCPLPMNKQKGNKKNYAFFTGIVNMLIEKHSGGVGCDYDPKSLITFAEQSALKRALSRRVDGAFPSLVNPIAIWEIKEYYYTTTFGSRVADGVYESLLDGYELSEIRTSLGTRVDHVLMIDDYFTWWTKGRSYLCRICDMLHMGLVTEVLFGSEVLERLPSLVAEWRSRMPEFR